MVVFVYDGLFKKRILGRDGMFQMVLFACKSGQKHTWLSSIIAHPGGHFLCEPTKYGTIFLILCGSAFNCR